MSESTRISVLCEGDDDRVVLKELVDLCPDLRRLEVLKPRGGIEQVVEDVCRLVPQALPRAIVVLDCDELSERGRGEWFVKRLQTRLPAGAIEHDFGPRITRLSIAGTAYSGTVVVVAVGLHEDESLKRLGVSRYAMDDYVFRLVRSDAVYGKVSEVAQVPHGVMIEKLKEVTELLKGNGIKIDQTKRLLVLLRGVVGFRASAAEFAARFLYGARQTLGDQETRAQFEPLATDLEAAILTES